MLGCRLVAHISCKDFKLFKYLKMKVRKVVLILQVIEENSKRRILWFLICKEITSSPNSLSWEQQAGHGSSRPADGQCSGSRRADKHLIASGIVKLIPCQRSQPWQKAWWLGERHTGYVLNFRHKDPAGKPQLLYLHWSGRTLCQKNCGKIFHPVLRRAPKRMCLLALVPQFLQVA